MKIFLDANVCLDLLDSTRPSSQVATNWYNRHKDDSDIELYFSGDFITTIFYVLTQKRGVEPKLALNALEMLSCEVKPLYLEHSDFIFAKRCFELSISNDLEDLMVLASAKRAECDSFATNDKELLELKSFEGMDISKIDQVIAKEK